MGDAERKRIRLEDLAKEHLRKLVLSQGKQLTAVQESLREQLEIVSDLLKLQVEAAKQLEELEKEEDDHG